MMSYSVRDSRIFAEIVKSIELRALPFEYTATAPDNADITSCNRSQGCKWLGSPVTGDHTTEFVEGCFKTCGKLTRSVNILPIFELIITDIASKALLL